MDGVSLKYRAALFAICAGAVTFILTLLVGEHRPAGPMVLARASTLAAMCALLCWLSARQAISVLAASLDAATQRLAAAGEGDLSTPVPARVTHALPELGAAMGHLFVRLGADLDNVQMLAMYDPITSLANRTNFCRQVEHMLTHRETIGRAALFFIDLDGFKSVNDTLGHAAGDQLLSRVAGRLREVVMKQVADGVGNAVVGRLAGDEFTIFFPNLPHRDSAARIAWAIQGALDERFEIDGQQIELGASIGVAFHPEHGATLSSLLRSADLAMYQAKADGRGRIEYFTDALASEMAGKAELERDLRIALDRGEFLLQFQPQFDLARGDVAAAEALVRWAHPARSVVMPATFVPLAEECGLIVELGDWVMDKVCETVANWARLGVSHRIAMNISTRELAQYDFSTRLRNAMQRHQAPPAQIELEITESLAMDMDARVLGQLRALRGEGVRIAIDDFGTGYSNLARLKDLPVDRVKIDRSLVKDIGISAEARTICSAVIGLIHGLGLEVVIEGIENQDQIDMLRVIGCTVFQGYLLARPADEADYLNRFTSRAGEVALGA